MHQILKKKKQLIVLFVALDMILLGVLSFNVTYAQESSPEFTLNNQIDLPEAQLGTGAPTAYAIVIGIEDYPGTINDLEYCYDDMKDVRSLLVNEMGYLPENVYSLYNRASTSSNLDTIFDSLTTKMTSEDTLFFYYSGHGDYSIIPGAETLYSLESDHPYANDEDIYYDPIHVHGADGIRVHFTQINMEAEYDYVYTGDPAFLVDYADDSFTGSYTDVWSAWTIGDSIQVELMSDADNTEWGFAIDKYQVMTIAKDPEIILYDDLSADYGWGHQLDAYFDALPAKEIYFVADSCFSGGFTDALSAPNRVILTACLFNETSIEDSDRQQGCFTYYFLNAFGRSSSGKGAYLAVDDNFDGIISWDELSSYCITNTYTRSNSLLAPHTPAYQNDLTSVSSMRPMVTKINCTTLNFERTNLNFSVMGSNYITKISFRLLKSDLTEYEAVYPIGSGYEFGTYEIEYNTGDSSHVLGYIVNVTYANNMSLLLFDYYLTTDSDSDFVKDGIETALGTIATGPTGSDSDGDGLRDYQELCVYGTNVLDDDTDGDTLNDGAEINTYFTTPFSADCDNDNLTDYQEMVIYNTDPFEFDTDRDGYGDLEEILAGSNPNNYDVTPASIQWGNILTIIIIVVVVIVAIVVIVLLFMFLL
jgi:hypothetical protein